MNRDAFRAFFIAKFIKFSVVHPPRLIKLLLNAETKSNTPEISVEERKIYF